MLKLQPYCKRHGLTCQYGYRDTCRRRGADRRVRIRTGATLRIRIAGGRRRSR